MSIFLKQHITFSPFSPSVQERSSKKGSYVNVKGYDKIRDGTCPKFGLFVTQKSFSSINLLLVGLGVGGSELFELNK
jgi:hypothetical protein